MHLIAGDAACISGRVAQGMLADSDGDDQLAFKIKLRTLEVVGFGNRLRRGAIGAGEGSERVSRLNFVITPPEPHVGRDRGNGSLILLFGSGRQVQLKPLALRRAISKPTRIQSLEF